MNSKKIFVLFAALLMVASFSFAQTADEIIAKYVKVTGGEAKYKAIKSSYAEGTFSMPAMGMEFKFKRYSKRPDKMKNEMVDDTSGAMIVQCVNGDKGWMINSFMGITEPVEMDEMTFKTFSAQADPDGFMFNREKNGMKTEYVGLEDRAGLKVHKINITNKEGMTTSYYFDSDSGILMGTETTVEQMGQQITTETRMADYKEVGGLLVPHTITIMAQGMEMSMVMTKVSQNIDIADSIFEMPKTEK